MHTNDNRLIFDKVSISNNRIDYKYKVEGQWKKYFNLEEEFFVEYSTNIDAVPESICVLPALGNFLPMSWIFDAEIVLNSIDKDFYDAIPEIKKGYIEMYPMLNFGGSIKVNNIEENTRIPEYQNTRIPEYQNTRIPECQNTRMPEYQNARIPECQNTRMPEYQN